MQVLLDQAASGIQHHDGDMALLDGFQRLDDRELLGDLADVLATADAGSIDQHVRLATTLEGDLDGVACRARLVEDHHALLAEQSVDQGRLAHIGPSDHSDTNTRRAGVGGNVRITLGEGLEHFLYQGGDIASVAAAMERGSPMPSCQKSAMAECSSSRRSC